METTRQNKIARLLQKELSDIFLLQTKSMPGVLISVSAVRISPDLSVARAYLSIFPSEKAEEIIKNVNDNMKSIRYELGTRVRHQLRIIPELKFFVDDSLDYLEKIDELSVLKKWMGSHAHLSTYTIRHTWATMAYHCEIHPGIISEAMGHSSIKVTETYLKPFQNQRIDQANQEVISFVKGYAAVF